MRVIEAEKITEVVKNLFLDLNFNISEDILIGLKDAYTKSQNETEKYILDCLFKNHEIAKNDNIAICQDTGMAVLFIEYGDEVCVKGFSEAVNEGVKLAYSEGYLRKSVVNDPLFERKNTNNNTPAIIHTEIVSGDKIKITAAAKGFGSENMSNIKMFNPTASAEEISSFIIETVKKAGPNPCPPTVIGVGIGGTFEKCAILAKKATLRPINTRNTDIRYAELENKLLDEINKLDIGCGGFGGNTSALAVNIENYPTHIAGLPVAVNISCHATRHKSCII